MTEQAALEVTAGPIFADTAGELRSARDLVHWYPDDIWRYALACDWDRIGWDRPYIHPDPAIAIELRRGIADAQVLQLNVDILVSPTARRRLILDERPAG